MLSSALENTISAVVTGASSGIGAEIAREFSKNGYFVYLLGRSEDKLKAVQKTCAGPTKIYAFDLKELDSHEKSLLHLFDSGPRLQVLINNAGIYQTQGFEQTSDQTWSEQFAVNLLAPVKLTKLIWPVFIKNKNGSIVNISSTLGIKPVPHTSAYSASKAAMNNWTLSLAQEGGAFNIRANAICPGIVDTPIHSFHNLEEKEKNKVVQTLSSLQLLAPLGQPKDVATAAYFLASDASSWTTGAILSVDGGINLK